MAVLKALIMFGIDLYYKSLIIYNYAVLESMHNRHTSTVKSCTKFLVFLHDEYQQHYLNILNFTDQYTNTKQTILQVLQPDACHLKSNLCLYNYYCFK